MVTACIRSRLSNVKEANGYKQKEGINVKKMGTAENMTHEANSKRHL